MIYGSDGKAIAAANDGRLAIMYVPHELVWFFLFQQPRDARLAKILTPTLTYFNKTVRWEDCQIVAIEYDWQRNCFGFKLCSNEFEQVQPGDVIPRCGCDIETQTLHVLSDELFQALRQQAVADSPNTTAKEECEPQFPTFADIMQIPKKRVT